MASRDIAKRYAKALYQLSQELGAADKVLEELRAVASVVQDQRDLRDFLDSAVISPEAKKKALVDTLNGLKATPVLVQFVALLVDKRRIGLLRDIAGAFETEIDERNGVVRGSVRSAAVLSPERREQINQLMAKMTGKQVLLNFREDSQLIGGLVASVGSFEFDDTIVGHLRRMKEQINRRSH